MLLETIEDGYIIFKNNVIKIIIDDDDIPWFYGKYAALALGYKRTKIAIMRYVNKVDKIKFKNIKCDKYVKEKSIYSNGIYINAIGIYSLILHSKLPIVKKFKKWIFYDVLPNVRKYDIYVQIKNNKKNIIMLEEKIRYLTDIINKLKEQLKQETYFTDGIVYVIDYSSEQEAYKIDMTNDMNKRKKKYDYSSLEREIIYYKKHVCPLQLETCVKALLYEYKIENKKRTFACSKDIIIKSFKKCIKSINHLNNKEGDKQFLYDKILHNTVKECKHIKNKQLVLLQIFGPVAKNIL